MKKISVATLCLLAFFMVFCSLRVFAIDNEERIVMIAIPDENGNLKYYKGEEAKEIYEQIIGNTEEFFCKNSNKNIADGADVIEGNDREVRSFHYRYRFIKDSSGKVSGKTQKISQELVNESSLTQKIEVAVSSSTTWSINTSLSGGFKDVFESFVGSSWKNTTSFNETITMNVAPQTRLWLEFTPILNYVSGKSQKYFIPRRPGHNKKPVIVESKSVYSTSPSYIYKTMGNKTIKVTNGVYTWKETRLK